MRIVEPDLLRLVLIAGLVLHKILWEVLKRRSAYRKSADVPGSSTGLRAIKLLKIAFLAGLLVQTLFLDILQIPDDSGNVQTAGIVLYLTGLALAITGRVQLGDNWADVEDSRVLPGQRIVDTGIYRYVRHPIYTGDILLILGLELALCSWLAAGVLLIAPVVLRRAIAEEKLLRASLPGYPAYCHRTKRFLPFLY